LFFEPKLRAKIFWIVVFSSALLGGFLLETLYSTLISQGRWTFFLVYHSTATVVRSVVFAALGYAITQQSNARP